MDLSGMVNSYYWVSMYCFCDYWYKKIKYTIFETPKYKQYGGKHTYI